MSTTKTQRAVIAPNYTGPRLFGAPVGDFSALQTILIAFATAAASFFASTFLAIATMLVMRSMGRNPDFSNAYKFVGLPVGLTVLLVAGVYLVSLLFRRLRRK
jgi:hypothetical protein